MKSAGWSITMLVLFLTSALLAAADQPAAQQAYRVAPAILQGDPVPGLDKTYFNFIGSIAANRSGDIAFIGSWYDQVGRAQSGIFLRTGDKTIKIAMTGDPIPGIHGMVFMSSHGYYFSQVAINESGEVAILAQVPLAELPPRPVTGIFIFRNGKLSDLMIRDSPYVWPISINDKSEIAFCDYFTGIFVLSAAGTSTIVSKEQAVPGVSGASFTSFMDASFNNLGQVAFRGYYNGSRSGSGIFLYSQNTLSPVVLSGQTAPGVSGRTFDLFASFGLDNAGEVLFSGEMDISTLPVGLFRPAVIVRFGLYLYSGGNIIPVIVLGQNAPGDAAGTVQRIGSFALNGSGTLSFALSIKGDAASWRAFLLSDGVFLPASFYLTGDPPANAAEVFQEPDIAGSLLLTDSNAMILQGSISDFTGNVRSGAFLAFPVTAGSVPPDDFEKKGEGDLPAGWRTVWSNSGTGSAWWYDTGGQAAFSGSSVLRLYVGPGGGSTFILSEPIQVTPDQNYTLAAEMRYCLAYPSEAACFTVLQYDSAGNEIAINELDGVAGDNYWSWKSKALCIHTSRDAVAIRIRFGLTTVEEAYLDVDAIR